MRRTPSLPSLVGLLRVGVVTPDRVLSGSNRTLAFKPCTNKWLTLSWIVWNRILWSMGYMKGFLWLWWICWYCWESAVCKLTPLLLFIPFTYCLLFVCQSCKGIKDERKKTRIPLDWNFIWRFTPILWWECFPGPVEIICSPRQSVWRA